MVKLIGMWVGLCQRHDKREFARWKPRTANRGSERQRLRDRVVGRSSCAMEQWARRVWSQAGWVSAWVWLVVAQQAFQALLVMPHAKPQHYPWRPCNRSVITSVTRFRSTRSRDVFPLPHPLKRPCYRARRCHHHSRLQRRVQLSLTGSHPMGGLS